MNSNIQKCVIIFLPSPHSKKKPPSRTLEEEEEKIFRFGVFREYCTDTNPLKKNNSFRYSLQHAKRDIRTFT